MHWTPPSQHQINNVNNPFRHLTEQQLRNQTQLNERAEGLPDVLKESLAEGRYKGPQLYKEITRSGLKLGVVLNTAYFLYDNKEQDDPDFDPAEGDEAGPRIWEISSVGGSLVPSPGPLAKDYKKRYNRDIVAMIDDAFRKNNIKVSTMKFYTESTELFEGFELSESAKAAFESAKAIHKKLMQKGRVTPIDTDRYPKRKGLEGPFRSKKTGKVFYYDPKEGKYYDPNSDIYLDVDDVMEETSVLSENKRLEREENMDKLVKQLRSAYGNIDKIDPSKPTYQKIIKLLDSLDKEQLKAVVNAKIKFISKLAFNRLNKAMAGHRNAPLPKHTRLGEQMSKEDMVDAVNKMSKDELKKLMRDKKNPMAKLAFRRFNRMQNPKDYPSDQLDEGIKESYEIDEEMSNLSVVSESFDQVRDRVYRSVVKHGTYLGKDKNFGRHFWQYKDFLYVHGEGGKMMNNLGSVAIPSNKRMMKGLIAGDPPLTEETLDEMRGLPIVEKAVLKEGKNDKEATFELPNGGKAIDFGRWAAYVHKSAEEYDKLSGSSVRLVGITTDMKKRQELEAKLEEMGGFIKSTNSLTDEYTWDAQRGAYVRTDGDEGPEGVPVLIDKGNPVADEVPHVLKYPNTVERKTRTELGESTQDEVSERELELFITKDAQTYKQKITPIIKNLARKMKQGNFEIQRMVLTFEELAVKGFMYAVDHGIKRYKDEYGYDIELDSAAKRRVAQELLDVFREEIEEIANN